MPARIKLKLLTRPVVIGLLVDLLASPVALSVDVTSGPTLTMNPNGLTPLAGIVHLTTDVPTRVALRISNGGTTWAVEFPDFQTDHSTALLGLTPAGDFTVEVTVIDEANNRLVAAPVLNAVTGPLPPGFPLIDLLASNPGRMEPGLTMLDVIGLGANFVVGQQGFLIILGPAGEVVWYGTFGGSAMHKLPNGNLIYRQETTVFERDMLGNIRRTIELADPGVALHHDLLPTANGTFLSLTRQTVSVDGYPTSNVDPTAPTQTADVRDEPVVEFASDGRLLNSWQLVNMLDPRRVGYSTIGSRAGGFDVFHTNAVIEDPTDDSIIVSVRHQDAVVKFSRSTGDLKWIMGPHANWTEEFQPFLLQPVGEGFEWQYHQHAPMITSFGTLMLFDNGNFRASPFDGIMPLEDAESYSRAVEYSINEETMEVQQIWSFGSTDREWLYAGRVGDADRLAMTGNVLITFGGTSYTGGVLNSDLGLGSIHTRIIEVTHDEPAEKVFDVRIYNPTEGAPRVQVYRADRISSLYALTVIIDSDGDGVADSMDAFRLDPDESVDTDSDGIGNTADTDDDGDGLSDDSEIQYNFDPLDASDAVMDADGDGISNLAEVQAGTDPRNAPDEPIISTDSSRLDFLTVAFLILIASCRISRGQIA